MALRDVNVDSTTASDWVTPASIEGGSDLTDSFAAGIDSTGSAVGGSGSKR